MKAESDREVFLIGIELRGFGVNVILDLLISFDLILKHWDEGVNSVVNNPDDIKDRNDPSSECSELVFAFISQRHGLAEKVTLGDEVKKGL